MPKPGARDLGIPFEDTPGKKNAIADVVRVAVGQCTLIVGRGKLRVGKGPVRTGVTALLLRGRSADRSHESRTRCPTEFDWRSV